VISNLVSGFDLQLLFWLSGSAYYGLLWGSTYYGRLSKRQLGFFVLHATNTMYVCMNQVNPWCRVWLLFGSIPISSVQHRLGVVTQCETHCLVKTWNCTVFGRICCMFCVRQAYNLNMAVIVQALSVTVVLSC